MPTTIHVEKHFTAAESVRDVVIGMADGLTVPFALAAGLAGAVGTTNVVVVAGLAEIAAGSIAMGLGGYLAARTDAEHYAAERLRELEETNEVPAIEREEVAGIFRDFGVPDDHIADVTTAICSNKERWVDFMMRFELGLERPEPGRARRSAITIAISYIVGGLIPLAPYMLLSSISSAFLASVVVTLLALLIFGVVKATYTGVNPLRGGLQTTVVGGLAAGAAYAIARMIS
ncbi:MAG: VIT1/CCC1 transporter family protein [Phycisphaerales bacterium]|nr:VIT1/CCC1 transporter family protein [Phycisphaerales bacterium]MCB9863154.1 VIT1/CCC1 transporter family protein [Phycisphaerales bacterium]